MEFHLAQVNIARMIAPIDSPVMSEFVANLDPINILAENSEGFIWRLKDDQNNATSINIYDDDFLIVNMSVWSSVDSLFQFTYKSNHIEVFKKRSSWFEKMPEMHMALWYVPAGHEPTVKEAEERLNHIREHGDTPRAFSFKRRFTEEEYQSAVDSARSTAE
jgi:hypothetical protein